MAEDVLLSHWHQSIPVLSIVPSEFYEAVSQAILKRNVPGVNLAAHYFAEGAIGSAQRLYLRAKRNEYHFDICGAPFADGSFVSWWLVEEAGCARGCLSAIPIREWMLLALCDRSTVFSRTESRHVRTHRPAPTAPGQPPTSNHINLKRPVQNA